LHRPKKRKGEVFSPIPGNKKEFKEGGAVYVLAIDAIRKRKEKEEERLRGIMVGLRGKENDPRGEEAYDRYVEKRGRGEKKESRVVLCSRRSKERERS